MEDVGSGQKKERKPICYFNGANKGLVLNVTNFNSIAEFSGEEDSDNWAGKRIALVPARTDFQGRQVDCIRISAASSSAGVTPVPPPLPEPDVDDDPLGW